MSTGNNDRISSITIRSTPPNRNSTNRSERMGQQLGISVSSSGQQQRQLSSNNSSLFVSPSPGSSTASILLGPSSSSVYHRHPTAPRSSSLVIRRKRSSSNRNGNNENQHTIHALIASSSNSVSDSASISLDSSGRQQQQQLLLSSSPRSGISLVDSVARSQCRSARKINDSMVYLDGPQIYTCANCRTHLTSHDEIISKSFHGRHGRAYLFDYCVNVKIGPAEDRLLITGLHSVSDIFCKRCEALVGWTYSRAYENSQKYKEGKFIVEKINLHLEESDYYDVAPPAGERKDRFRARSISWGSDGHHHRGSSGAGDHTDEETIYEYRPSSPVASSLLSSSWSPRSPHSL